MKLVYAIVHDEDQNNVITSLNENGFSVTKLFSTGAFRAGTPPSSWVLQTKK